MPLKKNAGMSCIGALGNLRLSECTEAVYTLACIYLDDQVSEAEPRLMENYQAPKRDRADWTEILFIVSVSWFFFKLWVFFLLKYSIYFSLWTLFKNFLLQLFHGDWVLHYITTRLPALSSDKCMLAQVCIHHNFQLLTSHKAWLFLQSSQKI